MIGLSKKIKIVFSLGLINVARVLWYKASLKLGFNKAIKIRCHNPSGVFFSAKDDFYFDQSHANHGVMDGENILIFDHIKINSTFMPPDWHFNYITYKRFPNPKRNWWEIRDFEEGVGDIKLFWDLSRFGWLIVFAKQARGGDQNALHKINLWLSDWCQKNPPYKGVNWKCGQEASIRVMHLMMAVKILEKFAIPTLEFTKIVEVHLRRIVPTIQYAIAQNNNHSTSEAAALFMGGSFLVANDKMVIGKKCYSLGRKLLQNGAEKLIQADGTFSQYSLNYHRIMLETFNLAELWRIHLSLPLFSWKTYERLSAATNWLNDFIVSEDGRGPNLGANDGARLFPITVSDYTDFRPTLHLSSALFLRKLACKNYEVLNEWFEIFAIKPPEDYLPSKTSKLYGDGGYSILRQGDATAFFYHQLFKFRPSQSDALHVDFWLDDKNILRDGGSYSYSFDNRWHDYFTGVASHNTFQFDNRDQMPRLGRFLFGDWLKLRFGKELKAHLDNGVSEAHYRDNKHCYHGRSIHLEEQRLIVTDQIKGFQKNAVLRWRLLPANWKKHGNTISCDNISITISSDMPTSRFQIVEGWESHHYLKLQKIPVLEVEFLSGGRVTTEIGW